MSSKRIYPEIISVGDPEPAIEQLTSSMQQFLGDPEYRSKVGNELKELAEVFAKPGASRLAAEVLLADLAESLENQARGSTTPRAA